MSNGPDDRTLDVDIKDLRKTLNDALKSIKAKQNVDLSTIGTMVEQLISRLQQEVITMEPTERNALLDELTQIVSSFGALEEAYKAHAAFPAGLEDGMEN